MTSRARQLPRKALTLRLDERADVAAQLEDLAAIEALVAGTGRTWTGDISVRFDVGAGATSEDLVAAGAIGPVRQTPGTGPHRVGGPRLDGYWRRQATGGILCDIGSDYGETVLTGDGAPFERIDCHDFALPYFPRRVADVRDRTETAVGQALTFLATRLALQARAMAEGASSGRRLA